MIVTAAIIAAGLAALGGGYALLSNKIIDKADDFVGINEKYGNKGFEDPSFEDAMRKAGWRTGQAWCMYFARMIWMNHMPSYIWSEAKALLSGSTQISYNKVRDSKVKHVFITDKPRVGFIAIWQSKADTTLGHAGIVYKLNQDGTMQTIEGNTNRLDSREGEGVYEKNRDLVGIGNTLRLRGFIGFKTK